VTALLRDDWFYADGTHLRPSGARAYADLLAHALRWIGPDNCACEGRVHASPMITSSGGQRGLDLVLERKDPGRLDDVAVGA
jgi:hypothetical protein